MPNDVRPCNASGEDLFKDIVIEVDQDVNTTTFTSDLLEVVNKTELAYGISAAGNISVTIDWTDVNGTTLHTEDVVSSASSGNGTIPVRGRHFQITVADESAASNAVTGTFHIH